MKTIKKESISKILKMTLLNYMSNSSIHGFSNIVRTTNIVQRLIWIIIALAGSGCSFYSIRNYVVDYFDYPTVTKTEIINKPKPDFPVVRICGIDLRYTGFYFDEQLVIMKMKNVDDQCYEFNSGKFHN